jgi:Tfp pilus assembly protein PilF
VLEALGALLYHAGAHAVPLLRAAQRRYPSDFWLNLSMAHALREAKQAEEAEGYDRVAVALRPDVAAAHNNLGGSLENKKDLDAAIAEYRTAIELDPKLVQSHYNLGQALRAKKDLDGAIAEYRTAIDIDPKYAKVHCNLGHALRSRGRFEDALESLRRGHVLGSKTPGWPYPSADWVRQCERLVVLDEKLPVVLNGEAEPTNTAERVALAQLCQQYKHRHAAAARLYADAFAADPRVAADLRQQLRYNAACSAALAAAGQAEDAKNLPDKVQRMLQRQALSWLRADLALYAKRAEREEAATKQFVRQRLAHWQKDTDLASVRDKEALGKLPDDEREEWRQLWNDVAALLKRVQEKK